MTAMERLDHLCASTGITLAQLRGFDQTPETVSTRRLAARMLRVEYGLSYAAIGRMLNRDHSTVAYMLKGRRKKPAMVRSNRDWLILGAA